MENTSQNSSIPTVTISEKERKNLEEAYSSSICNSEETEKIKKMLNL